MSQKERKNSKKISSQSNDCIFRTMKSIILGVLHGEFDSIRELCNVI